MLFYACLSRLSAVCLCFSLCYSGSPADRANVLRGLSCPSPHKLAQETFHWCTCLKHQQVFFFFFTTAFMFLFVLGAYYQPDTEFFLIILHEVVICVFKCTKLRDEKKKEFFFAGESDVSSFLHLTEGQRKGIACIDLQPISR